MFTLHIFLRLFAGASKISQSFAHARGRRRLLKIARRAGVGLGTSLRCRLRRHHSPVAGFLFPHCFFIDLLMALCPQCGRTLTTPVGITLNYAQASLLAISHGLQVI